MLLGRAPETLTTPSSSTDIALSRTAAALSVTVAAIGVLVVVGWVLECQTLLRLNASLPVMPFNTAVLLVAVALALWSTARRRWGLRVPLGAIIVVVSVIAALQFLLDWNSGIDTFLWTPFLVDPEWPAGRIALATAIAFSCLGIGLVAAVAGRASGAIAGGNAVVVFSSSLFNIAAYAFGRGATSPRGQLGSMALHSAIGLSLSAAALFCVAWRDSPHRGRLPTWLPWAGATGVLALTALLSNALWVVLPSDAIGVGISTAVGLGLSTAALSWSGIRLTQVARERVERHEAATDALALSELRHRAMFEQSSAGIVEVTFSGDLLRANQRFCDMVGRSLASLHGLRLDELTHPEDRARDRVLFEQALRGELPRDGWIKRYLRPDGRIVWAHVSGAAVSGSDGVPLYLVGVIQDVTSQMETEERLRESETRFRSVADTAAAGVVMMDATGSIVYANHATAKMFDYPDSALVGLPFRTLIPRTSRADQGSGSADILAVGVPPIEDGSSTLEGLRRDGSGFPIDLVISGWEAQGQRFFTGILRDVTERVEAQRALDRSRARLLAFVEQTPGAVAMLDRDLRYVAVSRRWLDDYQLGQRSLVGEHHYDVFPEIRNLPAWQAVHQRSLAGAVERCEEDHFVRADGRDEWIRWEVRPWTDERDDIGGIIMLTEVITSRKLAERALADSEQRLRLALENASHGLWDWNVVSGELTLDERWWRILGYHTDELPKTVETWQRTIHPEDRPRVYEVLDQSLASDAGLYDVDYRAIRKDGQVVWINTRGRVQSRDAEGRPLRMMGTIHDVTSRKRAEERLRMSLEEKDVLLREVHHRVKNNLAVMSSLFYLESTSTSHPEALRVLEESRNRIQSMALVHEFLYQSDNLAGVDFAEYATTLTEQLLGTMQRPDRTITLETTVVPLAVTVDLAIPCGLLLNELVTNCVKHAFVGQEAPASPWIRLAIARHSDGTCTLEVRDNGIGMKAVDPLRSKTLGLRLVRSLAEQIEGVLAFESASDGTRVRLTFRLTEETAKPPTEATPGSRLPSAPPIQ